MITRKRLNTSKGPVRLDRLAEALLDPVVSRAGFSSTQIIAAWADIVGPELASCTRPEKLRWPTRRDDPGSGKTGTGARAGSKSGVASGDGATLVVRAEGGDALELQHMSGHVIARINSMFGWRAVARISIRQAPVVARTDLSPTQPGAGPEDAMPPDAAAEARLSGVEDDELRAALGRLGARVATDRNTKV